VGHLGGTAKHHLLFGVARSPSRAERADGDDAKAVMAAPNVLDQPPRCSYKWRTLSSCIGDGGLG
jgi:hypothetical protein